MDLGLDGASKGIGKTVAVEQAREGCRVVLGAGRFGEAFAVSADVTKPKEVERLVAETEGGFGSAEILVNDAGGTGGTGGPSAFEKLSDEQWLDLNVMSAVRLARAVQLGIK